MLIVWLQGIWLPLHGYSFEETPLWSAIFMLPLTVGFLIAGPVAGYFSDRSARVPFAVGGMVVGAASFVALMALPADFDYAVFAVLLFAQRSRLRPVRRAEHDADHERGAGAERGQASGMRATMTNAGQVLSIGLFFSLMILGLAASLPQTMEAACWRSMCRRRSRIRSPTCRRSPACSPPSSATIRWAS